MNTLKITDSPNLKTSQIMQQLRDKFTVWTYYDDKELDKQFLVPKQETIRYFLDSQEPDTDTLGLSTNQVAEKYSDKSGITLRERLLLELAYFEKHGEHMDIKGITFCSGSRNSDGYVPSVYWYPSSQEVEVGWCYLDDAHAEYGVRSAVSLTTLTSFPSELSDEQAIEHLKAQGYKVTKEITTVQEF